MGVTCQILVDNNKGGVHRPGQKVTGIVKFAFDSPSDYNAVTLSFLGTSKCSWSESEGHYSESDSKTTRYTGSKDYVKCHKKLINQIKGTSNFDVGSYSYRFKFQLPEDIPSTFENSNCAISYRIEMKFEPSQFFRSNKTFITEIPVYGYIQPTTEGPVSFTQEKTVTKLFSTQKAVITLKAEIAKSYLTPDEDAYLTITVTNNTDVEPSVTTDLVCFYSYFADGRVKETCVQIKDSCSEKVDVPKRSVTNLSQIIPIRTDLYSVNSEVMKKEYKLRVRLGLPFPNTDVVVDVPVLIGEKKPPSVEVAEEAVEETYKNDRLPLYEEVLKMKERYE